MAYNEVPIYTKYSSTTTPDFGSAPWSSLNDGAGPDFSGGFSELQTTEPGPWTEDRVATLLRLLANIDETLRLRLPR